MVDGGDQARAFAERHRATIDAAAPVNQPPGPLLMTQENRTGWRFEDLAEQLVGEMFAKRNKLERELFAEPNRDKRLAFDEVRRNYMHIIAALELARTYQLATMRLFDSLGPDQGPAGTPRIGGAPVSTETPRVPRFEGSDAVQIAPPASEPPHHPV